MRTLVLAAALLAVHPAFAAPPGPADRDRALEICKTGISYKTTASADPPPGLRRDPYRKDTP